MEVCPVGEGKYWEYSFKSLVEHFEGFCKVAAVNWVQCWVYKPSRAVWYHWPEFSSGESLCLRYIIATKANCPLETSLLRLNLLLLQQ